MSNLKTPATVTADIQRRLTNNWHTDLAGTTTAFPHTFFLGRPTKTALEANWAHHHNITVALHEWADRHGVDLDAKDRIVYRTTQTLPEYATVNTIDIAAQASGPEWPRRIAKNRDRLSTLADAFPHIDLAAALRATDKYQDTDFGVLLDVADWFNTNPGAADGLTPRMVPIPGVHAKWLQGHSKGIAALTGVTVSDLIRHPQRIHFTYLDPDYRATGERIHDSATVGDNFTPAYQPDVVLVSENKDTAIHFPPTPRAIALEGVGRGGKTAASFPWIRNASIVIYWGDIDSDGYEILNGYREDFDRDIPSILMDPETYTTYEPYGTRHDRKGNLIGPSTQRATPRLTTGERATYEMLHSDAHAEHRRIEQERIPLSVAAEAVTVLVEANQVAKTASA